MNNNNSKSGVMEDTLELIIDSKSENESFARVAVAAFCTRLDPTLEEITDIKTAVSEAVTNCIVHGYEGGKGKIYINVNITGNTAEVIVKDNGIGLKKENLKKIFEKFYRCIQPNLSRRGLEWDSHLWRHLWMNWRFLQQEIKEPQLL